MKKTLYSIGVLLVVGIFAYYAATTLSKNDQNNTNENANRVVDSDWSTYTQISGLSFDYPKDATVIPEDHDGRLFFTVTKDSGRLTNYSETYNLVRNTGTQDYRTIDEYVKKQTEDTEYKNSFQKIELFGKDAYQLMVKRSTDIYLGTYFQDEAGNYYNFYIEQGAPSLAGEMIEELPQSYLDEIEETYNRILNSIEIE